MSTSFAIVKLMCKPIDLTSYTKLLSKIFVLFFTSCLIFLQPIFAMSCIDAISGVSSAETMTVDTVEALSINEQLDRIISLSVMSSDLEADIYSFRGLFEASNDQKALAELDRILTSLQEVGHDLEALSDQLLEEVSVKQELLLKISDELTQFSVDIKKIRYGNFEYQSNEVNIFRLRYLQDNPSEVVPNTVYRAKTHSSEQEVSFLFSRGIVSDLFETHNNLLVVAVEKSLSSIRKGVFNGSYEGQGIIKLMYLEDGFVEIRQRSKSGNVRIYGYTHEGVFHFVYWSQSSDHGVKRLQKVNNAIKKAKERRGH